MGRRCHGKSTRAWRIDSQPPHTSSTDLAACDPSLRGTVGSWLVTQNCEAPGSRCLGLYSDGRKEISLWAHTGTHTCVHTHIFNWLNTTAVWMGAETAQQLKALAALGNLSLLRRPASGSSGSPVTPALGTQSPLLDSRHLHAYAQAHTHVNKNKVTPKNTAECRSHLSLEARKLWKHVERSLLLSSFRCLTKPTKTSFRIFKDLLLFGWLFLLYYLF